MRIIAMSQQECKELLKRVSIGRLGCSLDDQPYVVPVGFSYEPDYIYIFSTLGKKIKWMRQNPKVCLQADEIGNRSNWLSVIVTGTYVELREPQYTAQLEHALEHMFGKLRNKRTAAAANEGGGQADALLEEEFLENEQAALNS